MADDREQPSSETPADAVAAPPAPRGAIFLRPEHLYKAAGLLLLLALAYRFFDTLTQVLLIAYAAGVVGVALNVVVRLVPVQRRWVAAVLGVLVFALVGFGLWRLAPALLDQVRGLAGQVPRFQEQLGEWERQIRASTGLNVDLVGPGTEGWMQRVTSNVGSGDVLGSARGLFEALLLPVFILFGAFFAVASPNDRLLNGVLRATPADLRPAVHRILELLGARLLGWVKGTLISMLIVAVLTTGALWLIGVPQALLLGIFAGLAELVPLVGPWVGGAAATLAAFFADPQKAIWTAAATLVIQQLESYLITPLVMSRAAEVHPFVTLFAIFLFGALFGVLGILLAVPLVLLVWTLVQVLWVERTIDTDRDWIDPAVKE